MIRLGLYVKLNLLAVSNWVVTSSVDVRLVMVSSCAIWRIIGKKATKVKVSLSLRITSFAESCLAHLLSFCDIEHLVQLPIVSFTGSTFALQAMQATPVTSASLTVLLLDSGSSSSTAPMSSMTVMSHPEDLGGKRYLILAKVLTTKLSI